MACDICGNPNVVGVYSCGFGPMSAAYCQHCLDNRLAPYNIMVAYISCAGLYPEDINAGFIEQIQRILPQLGKTEEEFKQDVKKSYEEMFKDMPNIEAANERHGIPLLKITFEDNDLEIVIDNILQRYEARGKVDPLKIEKLIKRVAQVGYDEYPTIITLVRDGRLIISIAWVDILDKLSHVVHEVELC